MKQLSILIPTYNDPCLALVTTLQQQAEEAGISYEIIVADDGSTCQEVVKANRSVNLLPHCRLEERAVNSGRAAIRNFLAQQAQYDWLLFIDSDMVVCRQDFLSRYARMAGEETVVDGGIVIGNVTKGNLRALYEKAAEHEHTAEKRRLKPYQHIHTANLLIRRDVFLAHPFDERIRQYGYEDVLLGKHLQEAQEPIAHIDNPLSFEIFEDNAHFLSKTEEGLRTLHQFRRELAGYNGLLALANRLQPIQGLIRLFHAINKGWERQLLIGSHPNLKVFQLYRLGFFMSLR